MQVSLFASSIRSNLWPELFNSLDGNTIDLEVVFTGNLDEKGFWDAKRKIDFKYIKTGNIKPAQAYEAARRACTGELICWIADDCEFKDDVIGKAYRFWKANCARKDVICIRTRENYGTWRDCDNTCHHFFSNCPEAPKMAPIGMMNREYFNELGGIDRRFISGQWDNELMMRVYNDGGRMFYFGDAYVELDHARKHDQKFGVSMERPFAKAYLHDRKILEAAWGQRGQMKYKMPYLRFDNGFEPYEDKDLLTKSQSFNLENIFND
jgi:hypothetical protein